MINYPPRHHPRWQSGIFLTVLSVRVRVCASLSVISQRCSVAKSVGCFPTPTFVKFALLATHLGLWEWVIHHWNRRSFLNIRLAGYMHLSEITFYCVSIFEGGLGSRNSVRPSVCPSVTRVDCDKSKWYTAHILIPHERAITLLLWYQQWLVINASFPPKSALKVTHPT